MNDPNCIFCKIVAGEIPSVKVWEDDHFLAFLDLNPNVEGMTLVISKEHYTSKFLTLPDEVICDFTKAAKEVAGLLTRGLDAERVMLVAEGLDIDHAHLKLYPGRLQMTAGHPASPGDLEEFAKKIRG
jgi:diadenosine tetraphosphate (Ap4A) HIT family hydrolase